MATKSITFTSDDSVVWPLHETALINPAPRYRTVGQCGPEAHAVYLLKDIPADAKDQNPLSYRGAALVERYSPDDKAGACRHKSDARLADLIQRIILLATSAYGGGFDSVPARLAAAALDLTLDKYPDASVIFNSELPVLVAYETGKSTASSTHGDDTYYWRVTTLKAMGQFAAALAAEVASIDEHTPHTTKTATKKTAKKTAEKQAVDLSVLGL